MRPFLFVLARKPYHLYPPHLRYILLTYILLTHILLTYILLTYILLTYGISFSPISTSPNPLPPPCPPHSHYSCISCFISSLFIYFCVTQKTASSAHLLLLLLLFFQYNLLYPSPNIITVTAHPPLMSFFSPHSLSTHREYIGLLFIWQWLAAVRERERGRGDACYIIWWRILASNLDLVKLFALFHFCSLYYLELGGVGLESCKMALHSSLLAVYLCTGTFFLYLFMPYC